MRSNRDKQLSRPREAAGAFKHCAAAERAEGLRGTRVNPDRCVFATLRPAVATMATPAALSSPSPDLKSAFPVQLIYSFVSFLSFVTKDDDK